MSMYGILRETPGFNPTIDPFILVDPTPEEYTWMVNAVKDRNANWEGKSKFTLVRIDPVAE